MEIEVRIDPALKGVKVTIEAPEETAEVRSLAARLEGPGRVTAFRGTEACLLEASDILRFYGEEKEVRAQTGEGVYTVRERLYELEARLAKRSFVRVSHSEIVNWGRVAALDLGLAGTIRVTLEGGVTTYVSRRYVKKIKEVLGL